MPDHGFADTPLESIEDQIAVLDKDAVDVLLGFGFDLLPIRRPERPRYC
jgi:hypothetical protein